MNARNLFSLIFLLLGSLHVAAEPIVLQISVFDGIAIKQSLVDNTTSDLERAGRKVINVTSTSPRFLTLSTERRTTSRVRTELLKQIRSLNLGPEDKIDTLIINTHGSSTDPETTLGFLGKIYETGPDDQFKEIFDPLLPNISSELRIILVSCSTFCGSESSTAKRANAIFNYFKVTEGSLFGAKTRVIYPSEERGIVVPTFSEIKFYGFAYMSMFTANLFSIVLSGDHFLVSKSDLILQLYGLPLSVPLGIYGIKRLFGGQLNNWLGKMKIANWGTLYRQKDGQLVEANPISLTKDKNTIFRIETGADNCAPLLD